MKDFFLLVKALIAGSIKVVPQSKKKRTKPKNYVLSYILSLVLSSLSFTITTAGITIGQLAASQFNNSLSLIQKQEMLSSTVIHVFSGLVVSMFIFSLISSLNNFFPGNDEFVRFLPIKGTKLYYARFFLLSVNVALFAFPQMLVLLICYIVFSKATFLGFLTGFVYSLLVVALLPLLSFPIILFINQVFKISSKKRRKILFNVFGILLYFLFFFASFYAFLLRIESREMITEASAEFNNFSKGISFIEKIVRPFYFIGRPLIELVDLNNLLYLLVLFGLAIIVASLIISNQKVANKFYFLELSQPEQEKKKKAKEKNIDLQIDKKIQSNQLKAYIKLALGNVKANLSFYIGQIISVIFATAFFTGIFCVVVSRLNAEGTISTDLLSRSHNISFLVAIYLLSFFSDTNQLIFVSLSVEKVNFYMLKSYPIDRKKYFLSKYITSSLFTLPLIIASCILVSIFGKFKIFELFALTLYILSIYILGQFVFAIFGFLKPNFNMIFTAADLATRTRKGSFKYSLYQTGITLLSNEPLNLLLIPSIIFIVFKLPIFGLAFGLSIVNIVIAYFMYKLALKSLDYAFIKEFNI